MKKLFSLFVCCSFLINVYAGDHGWTEYYNHTLNISGADFYEVNVIANIGDTVTLTAFQCEPCVLDGGQWYFVLNSNFDSIPNSQNPLTVVITGSGTYHVLGTFPHNFNVCAPSLAIPVIHCQCPTQNVACPMDYHTYKVTNPDPCSSYIWTPPVGATIVSGGTSSQVNIIFDATFTGDTLRVSASNSMQTNPEGKLAIYCPASLGVQDIYQNIELKLTPNPFTDKINVSFKDNELSEITLYDITSRKLIQQKFTNSVTLNTAPLAKGIYIYEVSNKNGVIKTGKVVKE